MEAMQVWKRMETLPNFVNDLFVKNTCLLTDLRFS